MIQHAAFKHGWFYHYRLHVPRSQTLLSDFGQLREYLQSVFTECPHDKFQTGPRSSKLRFPVAVDVIEIRGHEMCSFAAASLEYGSYNTGHSNVEMGLLSGDTKTISVEVPLWLDPHEVPQYEAIFGSTDSLTGHIDILRVEEGKVWIWDYKPKAHKERWATTQLNTYATMLSKRTGIPLEDIRCGYFDDETSYVFAPIPLSF